MNPDAYLVLSGIIFSIGALGVLLRRNAIVAFMSVELMLNAANLAFVTGARVWGNLDGQTIPADGIYAGWLTVGINRWSAAISIGTNPTFAGVRGRQVEAYALDQEGLELYDKNASIEFGWRLRDTLKFDGLEPLLAQMKLDCDRARALTQG